MEMTYARECHFDDCDTVFVGITRNEYVDHIREEHGEGKAKIYELVVVECPECAEHHKDERRTCDDCLTATAP